MEMKQNEEKKTVNEKNYCVHREKKTESEKESEKKMMYHGKDQNLGASVSVQFRWIYKIYNILAGESQPHQRTINESQ